MGKRLFSWEIVIEIFSHVNRKCFRNLLSWIPGPSHDDDITREEQAVKTFPGAGS